MRSWTALFLVIIIAGSVSLAAQFIWAPEKVTTFNLVATALFAALSALGSLLTIREMRQERIERNRPFIFVDFEMTGTRLMNWVIKNLGSGPAMNVAFHFDPVPINFSGNQLTDLAFFQQPIPIMVPGFEMKQFLDTTVEVLNSDKPRTFRVIVTYDWEGKKGEIQTFDVDLNRFNNLVLPEKTVGEVLHEMHQDLHHLSQALSGTVSLGRLRVEYHEPNSTFHTSISSQEMPTQTQPATEVQLTDTAAAVQNQTESRSAEGSNKDTV